jgi:hypothetical protein
MRKNSLSVSVQGDKFILSEVVYQPTEIVIGEFSSQKELVELAKSKGYTRTNLTVEAKALLKEKLALEAQNRKEAFKARKALAASKKAERIAKMEAQLAKLKASQK